MSFALRVWIFCSIAATAFVVVNKDLKSASHLRAPASKTSEPSHEEKSSDQIWGEIQDAKKHVLTLLLARESLSGSNLSQAANEIYRANRSRWIDAIKAVNLVRIEDRPLYDELDNQQEVASLTLFDDMDVTKSQGGSLKMTWKNARIEFNMKMLKDLKPSALSLRGLILKSTGTLAVVANAQGKPLNGEQLERLGIAIARARIEDTQASESKIEDTSLIAQEFENDEEIFKQINSGSWQWVDQSITIQCLATSVSKPKEVFNQLKKSGATRFQLYAKAMSESIPLIEIRSVRMSSGGQTKTFTQGIIIFPEERGGKVYMIKTHLPYVSRWHLDQDSYFNPSNMGRKFQALVERPQNNEQEWLKAKLGVGQFADEHLIKWDQNLGEIPMLCTNKAIQNPK